MKHLKEYQLLIGLLFIAIAILISGSMISREIDDGCKNINGGIAYAGNVIGN